MELVEKILTMNPENNTELTEPRLWIEISAIPEESGGGFHAVIPPLGRFFALADGDSLYEVLSNLNSFISEILQDPKYVDEYRKRYLEKGIKIP